MDTGESTLPEFGKYRAVREIGRGATSIVYLAEEILDVRAVAGADTGGTARSAAAQGQAAGQTGDAGENAAAGTAAGTPADHPADPPVDNPFPNLNWSDEPLPTPARVAVKLVDFTDDGSKLSRRFRKLFATEAAVSSQFDHPNITRVFDWKVEANRAYLVMEYLEGETLDKFITMDKLLPMHRTVGIIFKVAMALDYAHRRGIVNRDIKPANIMLLKGDEVKVMDFGLALNIKKNVNVDSTFINGLGSPSYMSPEQIKGYTLNHQTDLYSLGVMFYQLLTGRLPFRAASTAALIYKIVNMEAVPVTQLNPDIPELTNQVITRAMEKDLYSRYRLGADMAKDLSAVRYQILEEDQVVPNEARWKVIRGLPLLGKLDDIDIWELLRLSHWRELPPATVLMREGEAGGPFGLVLEGEVEIEAGSRALDKAVRGDMLGVMEWLDSEASNRSTRATTLTRVVYLEINPAAFAFATDELAGEIRCLAIDSLLKRARSAMLLAKRVSALAVHPAPDSDELPDAAAIAAGEPAPAAPVAPLGWGTFASIDASTPAAARAGPATTPVPASAWQTTVVAQPMSASATAAITRSALGAGALAGVAAGALAATVASASAFAAAGAKPGANINAAELPPSSLGTADTSGLTGAPLLPDEDRTVPTPPPVPSGYRLPADTVSTSELAPQFAGTSAIETSEMALHFAFTSAIGSEALAAPALPAQPRPHYDVQAADTTSEMAPNFSSTTAFEVASPVLHAEPDLTPVMPAFDVHQSGMVTVEMAPHFMATTSFDAGDLVPLPPLQMAAPAPPSVAGSGQPAPATTSAAPAFDLDKTVLMVGLAQSAEAPAALGPEVGFDPDKTVQMTGAMLSTLAIAAASPAPVSRNKPKPAPAFDPDKTMMLEGGFDVSSRADEPFTEELYTPADLAAMSAPLATGTARVRAKPPEDFDKTVEISGGFEAQPFEEDVPLDDLFPPIKF